MTTRKDNFTYAGKLLGCEYDFAKSDVPVLPGIYFFRFDNGCYFNIGQGGGAKGLQTLWRYGGWLRSNGGSTNEDRKRQQWRKLVDGRALDVWFKVGPSNLYLRRSEEALLTYEHEPVWNLLRDDFSSNADDACKHLDEYLSRTR